MVDRVSIPRPPALGALVENKTSLFLDFDGTLVDIAQGPGDIVVPDRLADGLLLLSARLEGRLALVSGRALADIESHCGQLAIARAGSHGAECILASGEVLASGKVISRSVTAELEQFAQEAGVFFERKVHGAALHWRSRPDAELECQAFVSKLARQHGLHVVCGKMVAELIPPGVAKSAAVEAFMSTDLFAGSTPVFVGDDVTDEDGFVACNGFNGFGVAVGERLSRAARYALPDVQAVYQWLELCE